MLKIIRYSEALSKSLDNCCEWSIRKEKIKQKITGAFRSDHGADAFFAIHFIADTAWKNNQLVLYKPYLTLANLLGRPCGALSLAE